MASRWNVIALYFSYRRGNEGWKRIFRAGTSGPGTASLVLEYKPPINTAWIFSWACVNVCLCWEPKSPGVGNSPTQSSFLAFSRPCSLMIWMPFYFLILGGYFSYGRFASFFQWDEGGCEGPWSRCFVSNLIKIISMPEGHIMGYPALSP